MLRKASAIAVGAVALALTLTGVDPVHASTVATEEASDQIAFGGLDENGKFIPAEEVHPVIVPGGTNAGTVTPQLINFGQWVSCFSLNNYNDVYANYTFYRDGWAHDLALRCGEQQMNGNGWGYKHIRAGKESQWQQVLNDAIAHGWKPTSQGVDGWDDLMAGAAGSALAFWSYSALIPAANKGCVLSTVGWWRVNSGELVMSKKVIVAFATDSDRIITVYPVNDGTTNC